MSSDVLKRELRALDVVQGKNGLVIDVAVTHARRFAPIHKDGSPYGVVAECDGWVPGRDAESVELHFTPQQAIGFALALIRVATRAQDADSGENGGGDDP